MKSVLLYDEEDDQCLRMEATNTRHRGIEVYARNEFNEKVILCVDAGLFKKFCQQAIKHIDARATTKSYFGEVKTFSEVEI